MDIEFGAYVIALCVRRVDNTKMVAEFLFVKVARMNSLNNLGFLWNSNPSKVKLPMLLITSKYRCSCSFTDEIWDKFDISTFCISHGEPRSAPPLPRELARRLGVAHA